MHVGYDGVLRNSGVRRLMNSTATISCGLRSSKDYVGFRVGVREDHSMGKCG